MFRTAILASLVCAATMLSACAESMHQVQRDTELLGIPLGLESEIDSTVSFADLKRSPAEYIGRTVMIGGNVIKAKRGELGTELEVLQLPTSREGGVSEERLRSEGRFLAVRQQFLDPASLPVGSPITVIGTVTGETTRQLDETDYTYPILEVKHIIDWNSVASQRRRDRSPYYGAYYPPSYGYGWGGYYPRSSWWGGPFGGFGGYGGYGGYYGRGFYGPSGGFSPRPSSPPPPPSSVHPRLRGR